MIRTSCLAMGVLAVVFWCGVLIPPSVRPALGDEKDVRPEIPTVAVDGRKIDWAELRERTVLVTFFSTRMQDLKDCLQSYQEIYEERRQANLDVVAVCIDTDRRHGLRAFLEENGFTFPVVVDAKGEMRALYQPKSIPHAYFFGEGGRYIGDLPGYPDGGSPSPRGFYSNLLRRAVGLDVRMEHDPASTPWPEIPDFRIPGTGIDRASLLGSHYIVAFVASDCDRCRDQLRFFRDLAREFGDQGLRFVVVLVSEDADAEEFREERGLPFPVHPDQGGDLRRSLKYRGFVPDTLIVDAEGRIRYRHTTFDDEQPPLYRMELRRILGLPNPPILKRQGPSGVRRCMVCHEEEYFDWLGTGHAQAMRSLQAIGSAGKGECVQCHVVGWGRAGGFDADRGSRAHLLGDVQCESCHTDGGPHLGSEEEPNPITAATCTPCHDEKHSLGFRFEEFVKLVRHSSDLFDATPEQRAAAQKLRKERRRELLEPDGAYVGADACRECHDEQFERWQGTPHARALQRLPEARRKDASCVPCHQTGFGRSWAEGKAPAAGDPTAAGVQCEACHGPGERHTRAESPDERTATIIGLGERCEECVIRQICTSCHDTRNDPEFELRKALPPMQGLCRPRSAK